MWQKWNWYKGEKEMKRKKDEDRKWLRKEVVYGGSYLKRQKNMRVRERQKDWKKNEKKKRFDLFSVVRFGDVSELLLDAVAIDVLEVEGPRGGSGQTAPLGGVPTGGDSPHRVHAGSLNFFDGFLDGIEAVQQSRVRLAEADVQQLPVVTLVLHQGKVGSFVSEEHHLDWLLEGGFETS